MSPAAPDRPPMRSRLWLFGVVLALVALDLWSKAHVFALLEDPAVEKVREGNLERILIFGEWFAWMRNLNYGAAFGRLTHVPYPLVILRCGAVLLVTWFILRAPRGQRVYLTALVLILAGAAGNLYDNFFFRPDDHDPTRPFGPVRDFIDFYVPAWDWHFATFNVADSCISVGAVLLIVSGLGTSASSDTASSDTASSDTASSDTASGDTASGDTASGDTASGDTASGDSETSDPKAPNPGESAAG